MLNNLRNLSVEEKINFLQGIRKGCNQSVVYQSFPATKNAWKDRVRKETRGVCRLGINYRKLKANQGREEESFEGLQKGQRFILNNTVIEKNKDNQISYLVRMYFSSNNTKPSVKYYLDNQEISKEELIQMGALSDSQREKPLCFNVKMENLLELGRVKETE